MRPHTPITYILTPFKPLPPPKPAKPAEPAKPSKPADALARAPARPERVPVAAEPQPITVPPSASAAESTVAATLPPDPFAVPVKPQDDLRQRAIKGALAADQKARKDAWTQRDRKYVNDETALATAIGKAYVGGGSGAIGEFTAPDGSRVTKWRLPGGAVVCYYKESNSFGSGKDPFRDTGRVSIRDCPN
ncbi:hypothetical protein [Duganella flavida]|uniref:hypothetical protein n=1 Tax=Duganella flavida TaxID=2692175 RepID=UPI001E3BE1C5|nr:hypothetical protein [Duganella flavida]